MVVAAAADLPLASIAGAKDGPAERLPRRMMRRARRPDHVQVEGVSVRVDVMRVQAAATPASEETANCAAAVVARARLFAQSTPCG